MRGDLEDWADESSGACTLESTWCCLSYSWFSVESALFSHPKVMALQDETACLEAEVFVLRMWGWCHRYAPSGLISIPAMLRLEQSIGWRGNSGALVAALKKTGFVDEVAGQFLVHDWNEHQSVFVEKSNRDAMLKRKKRREAARAARAAGARAAPPTERNVTERNGTERNETKRNKKKISQGDLLQLPAGDVPKPPRTKSDQELHYEVFQDMRAARLKALGGEAITDEPHGIPFINSSLKRIVDQCSGDDEVWELFGLYMNADAPAAYEPPFKFKAFVAEKWWSNLLRELRGQPRLQ